MTRAIRGAITVKKNSQEAIKKATVNVLSQMLEQNNISTDKISHAIFTMTKDLNAANPAKFARTELGFENVPMMCYQELDIDGALPMCLRVMLVVNADCKQTEIKHIYLKGAEVLRPDLK